MVPSGEEDEEAGWERGMRPGASQLSAAEAALEPRLHLEVYWVGVGLCGPHQPGIDCEL